MRAPTVHRRGHESLACRACRMTDLVSSKTVGGERIPATTPAEPAHNLLGTRYLGKTNFKKKNLVVFFGLGFRAKYLNGHFLPFFPVFGLFLATKIFSILAGLTIFFVTTIPNSGASEYPEESFLDAKNPKKKVEWSVA